MAFEKVGKGKEFEKYITNVDQILVGNHDVGIVIQNAFVTAESLGLTADIGEVRVNCSEIEKELNLQKYAIPMIGLCVGYPLDDPNHKPRMPMNSVFFEDKYDVEKAKAGVEECDEILKKYLVEKQNNSRDSNWSVCVYDIYIKTTGIIDKEYDLFKQPGFIAIDKK